jgi:hypothetical protein
MPIEKEETKDKANKTAIIRLKVMFEEIPEILVSTAVIKWPK